MAADVPCARCRHRAVGLGRRQGPAASPTGVLTRVVKPQAQVSGTSTTTANHCKGPRRYQCLSRLGRSHTHAPTLACPTALCRDGTRGVSSACAICKLLLREYAYARRGGVITVRFCRARTRTHTRTHACMPHHAVPGWHARSIIGMRDLQAAAARICICEGGKG